MVETKREYGVRDETTRRVRESRWSLEQQKSSTCVRFAINGKASQDRDSCFHFIHFIHKTECSIAARFSSIRLFLTFTCHFAAVSDDGVLLSERKGNLKENCLPREIKL